MTGAESASDWRSLRGCKRLGVGDEVVKEGAGGAHRDLATTAENLRAALKRNLDQLCAIEPTDLVARRYDEFRAMGVIEEARV